MILKLYLKSDSYIIPECSMNSRREKVSLKLQNKAVIHGQLHPSGFKTMACFPEFFSIFWIRKCWKCLSSEQCNWKNPSVPPSSYSQYAIFLFYTAHQSAINLSIDPVFPLVGLLRLNGKVFTLPQLLLLPLFFSCRPPQTEFAFQVRS